MAEKLEPSDVVARVRAILAGRPMTPPEEVVKKTENKIDGRTKEFKNVMKRVEMNREKKLKKKETSVDKE
jgi:hypothetical protein